MCVCVETFFFSEKIKRHGAYNPFFFLGENPLADDQSNHDINSVAGVLKLYFRGLENPLFPKERFNDLISCISKWAFTPALPPSLFTNLLEKQAASSA